MADGGGDYSGAGDDGFSRCVGIGLGLCSWNAAETKPVKDSGGLRRKERIDRESEGPAEGREGKGRAPRASVL